MFVFEAMVRSHRDGPQVRLVMIRRPMKQCLLHCILLLSLLFNTVVGVPLHASTHLHEGPHGVELTNKAASAAAEEPAVEHVGQAHGACVWCFTLGQLGGALTCAFAMVVPATHAHQEALQSSVVFVPNPGHWRFSSRDPPPVLISL